MLNVGDVRNSQSCNNIDSNVEEASEIFGAFVGHQRQRAHSRRSVQDAQSPFSAPTDIDRRSANSQ
jgi:hypothetical protein